MDEVFDRYPLPTFILDRSHRVIQWNRACQELSGISTEEILGKEVWEGFTIGDQGSIADMVIEDIDSVKDNFGESVSVISFVHSFCLWQFCSPLLDFFRFIPGFVEANLIIYQQSILFYALSSCRRLATLIFSSICRCL